MTEQLVIALISASALVAGAIGTALGAWLTGRSKTRADAQSQLIGSLQKELERYRERTDHRLDELESQVKGYRAFIGVQRDHMSAHGVPLPKWPEGLPR